MGQHSDDLCKRHTIFQTLSEMASAAGGYRPTLRCVTETNDEKRAELRELADDYDAYQRSSGDPRRVHRS